MHFSHLKLSNWRNFVAADVRIGDRLFVAGPNASGKSNLLDVFRFLRDLAKDGGGLQQAVKDRGGLTKLRCLAARRYPDVEIEVTLGDDDPASPSWRYALGLRQEQRGARRVMIAHERVWHGVQKILDRPDAEDREDSQRLTQTHLEQIASNKDFRAIADTFQNTLYLHLVPQLLKHPALANREAATEDPFGLKFLERVAATPEKTRKARLRKIEQALRFAVPELEQLTDTRDERGLPHLEAHYRHWRAHGGLQREDQFSDGTLRLIGLLWSLLEGDSLLLLEEPELSLHSAIVVKLPGLIWRLQRQRRRQVILSSHSYELFSDPGIRPEEVALLQPRGSEGTEIVLVSSKEDIQAMIEGGMTIADAVLPETAPKEASRLDSFE